MVDIVTARTIASELKLERMLYYENTKLRRRKRVARTNVNKYAEPTAKALVVGEPIVGVAEYGRIWQVTRPSAVTLKGT